MRALLLLAALLATPALAQTDAFPFGDPKLGRKVLEEKCSACHVRQFGGDGSGVYTRPGRKASGAQSLLAWVQRCNANVRTGLNGEEEESVAAYLNQQYYKFK